MAHWQSINFSGLCVLCGVPKCCLHLCFVVIRSSFSSLGLGLPNLMIRDPTIRVPAVRMYYIYHFSCTQVQPSNYCTFYDDQRQNWSLTFESEKAATDFCKEVCVSWTLSLSWFLTRTGASLRVLIVLGLSCKSELRRSVRLCPDPGSSAWWGERCGEWRLFGSCLHWLATTKPDHRNGKDHTPFLMKAHCVLMHLLTCFCALPGVWL